MKIGSFIVRISTDRPRLIAGVMLAVTLVLAVLAAVPSVWPNTFPMLHPVKVDTDPENMLSRNEAVRVFHNDMKKVFALNDIVVLGVVNETDENGVFNPGSLRKIYDLTQYALTLQGEAIGIEDPQGGVIGADVIAPSTVDNIEQGDPGVVKFEWLMPKPPETEADAVAIREKARRIPFLDGTLLSKNGKALALYLPLTSKDLSYRVYSRLRDRIAELDGEERFFITGLPVANDTFGHEMFVQMAISAPLAMLVIFLLMLVFFRKLVLIVSPMIIAMVAVICTMGLLVVTGNTIHIMSSMIPIFIMPIAVLDSIHILSEFFDRYQKTKDRRQTVHDVMDTLFMPMLYTSLTSTAGFASLALTPIPPVQVFGIFVAVGIMLAWWLTITFIPAYIMFIPEKRLANFGMAHSAEDATADAKTPSGRILQMTGLFTFKHAKLVVALSVVAVAIAAYGISKIQINDNPTKWFKESHPIRVADTVLNKHFGGTYMAYLVLRAPGETAQDGMAPVPATRDEGEAAPALPAGLGGDEEPGLPAGLGGDEEPALPMGLGGDDEPALPVGLGGSEPEGSAPAEATPQREPREETFKNPDVLRYMEGLQAHLLTTNAVGKSNSLADIVKTVHRELIDGDMANSRIPDSQAAVAQCLMQYQSSHRPNDLWHLVTPDYRQTSLWVQLRSGDNTDMSRVVAAVDEYLTSNPPPLALEHEWFGLTYINVVWQDKMVSGMLQAFLGSFLVVLLMMVILFRAGLWGFLSMIPLTITIGLIYGVIG
ncbi:MAG: MMPL family transporter, partial [bacterium]|nr:MMPL family transporter [bacterium]